MLGVKLSLVADPTLGEKLLVNVEPPVHIGLVKLLTATRLSLLVMLLPAPESSLEMEIPLDRGIPLADELSLDVKLPTTRVLIGLALSSDDTEDGLVSLAEGRPVEDSISSERAGVDNKVFIPEDDCSIEIGGFVLEDCMFIAVEVPTKEKVLSSWLILLPRGFLSLDVC